MGSGIISFGLVSIPIKVYSSNKASENISFNLLHGKCGGRMKQQYVCLQDDEIVERAEMIKGYEFAKGQYVTFSEEELKALEEKTTQAIEITEFVPATSVDPIYFDKTYFLGPDKHGDKPYGLLAQAMRETGRWALARYAVRGKLYVVLLRPFENGLVMQQLYYGNQLRAFSDLSIPEVTIKEQELQLAVMLADQVSTDAFNAESYTDEGRNRLQEMIQQKIEGQEVSLAPTHEKGGEVIDLMAALKASLGQMKPRGEQSAPQTTERKPARRAAVSSTEEPAAARRPRRATK